MSFLLVVSAEEREISTKILELLLNRTVQSAKVVLSSVRNSLDYITENIMLTENVVFGDTPSALPPVPPHVHHAPLPE